MAHNIYENDKVVLNKVQAWHNLGQVINDDMSPLEAYNKAFSWQVAFADKYTATFGSLDVPVNLARTLYRLPTNETEQYIELGTHGTNYTPVQNSTLIEIAYLLGDDVKVESAGSLFNGKKVFISLRSETFTIKNDQINCYLAIMNGHDGSIALSLIPTSTRVVCDNTLTQVIHESRRTKRILSYRHFSTITEVVNNIKNDLDIFLKTNTFKDTVTKLSNRTINSKEVLEFWSKTITTVEPTLSIENDQDEINNILHTLTSTMETEKLLLNEPEPTIWLAANAMTNYIQHKIPKRKAEQWEERRSYSNLIGDNANKSSEVMQLALGF